MGYEADRGNRGINIDGKAENCGECVFLIAPYGSRAVHCGRTGSYIESTKVCLNGRLLYEPQTVEDIDHLIESLRLTRSLLLAITNKGTSPAAPETLAS